MKPTKQNHISDNLNSQSRSACEPFQPVTCRVTLLCAVLALNEWTFTRRWSETKHENLLCSW